jgi:hypothetical protein
MATQTEINITAGQVLNILADKEGKDFVDNFINGEYDEKIVNMTVKKLQIGLKVNSAVANDPVLSTLKDVRQKY